MYDPRFKELLPLSPYAFSFIEYIKLFPVAVPKYDASVPVAQLYEGQLCLLTLAPIEPHLPWNESLACNATGAFPDPRICSRSNIWNTRKQLMKIFAISKAPCEPSSGTTDSSTAISNIDNSVAKEASKECNRLVLDVIPLVSDNLVSPPTSPPTNIPTPCISPEFTKRAASSTATTSSNRLAKKGLEYDNYKKRVLETLELSPRLSGKKSRNSKNTPQKNVPLLR